MLVRALCGGYEGFGYCNDNDNQFYIEGRYCYNRRQELRNNEYRGGYDETIM